MASPLFLAIRPGDFVVVKEVLSEDLESKSDWWIGQVIYAIGGARTPFENSLFQIANIDTGAMRFVNADLVIRVFRS